MVLTDADIRQAMKAGQIEISPFDKSRLGSNSYDVTLGSTLLVYTEEELDAKKDNPYTRFEIPEDEGFVLQPGELYLGVTQESTKCKVHVPFIEGKSSIGRLGISIHITAGFGDIGFSGYWTLELTAQKPVRVYTGMPIGQVWFMLSQGTCAQPYSLKEDAKYKNQPNMPMPSMMWKNFVKRSTHDKRKHSPATLIG
jgi:dCTP deaminase